MKKETNPTPCLRRLIVGVRDAAWMLGIAEQTLRNWLSTEGHPLRGYKRKLGGRTVFRTNDLEGLVDRLPSSTSVGEAQK